MRQPLCPPHRLGQDAWAMRVDAPRPSRPPRPAVLETNERYRVSLLYDVSRPGAGTEGIVNLMKNRS
jgi:hypothetical protein